MTTDFQIEDGIPLPEDKKSGRKKDRGAAKKAADDFRNKKCKTIRDCAEKYFHEQCGYGTQFSMKDIEKRYESFKDFMGYIYDELEIGQQFHHVLQALADRDKRKIQQMKK